MDFLIGTLTHAGGAGIGRVRLEDGRLRLLWTDGALTDPNWLCSGPDGRIFSVSSDADAPMSGCVNELRVTQTGMELVSRQPTSGVEPCFLEVSPDGRLLLCANYGTGSLAVFSLTETGIGPMIQLVRHHGAGPHPTRQTGPHLHQVVALPMLPGCYCAVDLGLDALVVYRQDARGLLTERYRIPVPAGQGPRHVACTRAGDAYLITELGNRVYPVRFGPDGGSVLAPGVSTLSDEATPGFAAALWPSADQRCLYASNRGEGTIVRLALPSLRREASHALMGSAPRDFCVVDEHRLLAACQDAGLTLLQYGVIADTLRFPGAVRVMRLP